MSPENLEKISHPELNISKDNLISVRNWGYEQTDRHTKNLKSFENCGQTSKECVKNQKKTSYTLLCAKIREISTMIFRKIYHAELEISLCRHNLSKELSQLTDWKTYKKLGSIKNYCSNIVVMSKKNSERYLIQNW